MLFIQQTLAAHFYGYILRFGAPGNHFTSVFLNWSIAIPDCDPLSSPSFLFSSSHSNSCHLLGQHPLLALFLQSTRLLDFTISKLEHNHSPTQCLIPYILTVDTHAWKRCNPAVHWSPSDTRLAGCLLQEKTKVCWPDQCKICGFCSQHTPQNNFVREASKQLLFSFIHICATFSSTQVLPFLPSPSANDLLSSLMVKTEATEEEILSPLRLSSQLSSNWFVLLSLFLTVPPITKKKPYLLFETSFSCLYPWCPSVSLWDPAHQSLFSPLPLIFLCPVPLGSLKCSRLLSKT